MPNLSPKNELIQKRIQRRVLSDITFAAGKDLADRQIRVIAASGKTDRTGDVVAIEGITLKNYKKNPIVLWAHDHSGLPVAKCVSMDTADGQLVMVFEFATSEEYAFADTVYKLIKGGYLKGVSIGAQVLAAEWLKDSQDNIIGRKYTALDLLEVSVVPIPADSKALITAVKSGAVACEEFEECLAKSFEAPLDFTEENAVDLSLRSFPEVVTPTTEPTEEEVDKEIQKAFEDRIAALEAQLQAPSESSTKLASALQGVLLTLSAGMKGGAAPNVQDLKEQVEAAAAGTPAEEMTAKLFGMIDGMTTKLSTSR